MQVKPTGKLTFGRHFFAIKVFRGVSSRECRAAELARLYVQTRVSGHKIWLHSRITSLSAGSVPVVFSSLDLIRFTFEPCNFT